MSATGLQEVCKQLALDQTQCNMLNELLSKLCPPCRCEKGEKLRKKSRWQQCITERRKGQPFDPAAIRQLAQEYKAGKCP